MSCRSIQTTSSRTEVLGGGLSKAVMSVQNIFEINIRSATNKDREQIIELVSSILTEYALQFDLESSESDLKDIEKTYLEAGGLFEIVESKDGTLLGTIGLYPLSESICKLRKLYLVPQARGIGLGKHILERSIDKAQSFGFRTIILETVEDMKEGIRLYDRVGFKLSGRKAVSPRCNRVYFLNIE